MRIEQSGSFTKGLPKPISFYLHIFSFLFQLTRHLVLWPQLLSLKHKLFFLFALYVSYQRLYCQNQYVCLDIREPQTFRAEKHVSYHLVQRFIELLIVFLLLLSVTTKDSSISVITGQFGTSELHEKNLQVVNYNSYVVNSKQKKSSLKVKSSFSRHFINMFI